MMYIDKFISCACVCFEIGGGGKRGPGLRGSHILRIGSEPPAAMRAEPSPPTSMQLRAFPQNCTKGYLSFKPQVGNLNSIHWTNLGSLEEL